MSISFNSNNPLLKRKAFEELSNNDHSKKSKSEPLFSDWSLSSFSILNFDNGIQKATTKNHLKNAGVPPSNIENVEKKLSLKVKLDKIQLECLSDHVQTLRNPPLKIDYPQKEISKKFFEYVKHTEQELQKINPLRVSIQFKADSTPAQIFKTILKNHPGFCIGEAHSDFSAKHLLENSLPLLKDLGVTTLFFEHLPYDTLQPTLDSYHTGKTNDLPPLLESYLPSYHLKDLVVKAKECQMRVVGIDTTLTLRVIETFDLENKENMKSSDWKLPRTVTMNFTAKEIIEREKNGKFIALMGAAHCTTLVQANRTIPGVSELTQVPHVYIRDKKSEPASTRFNVENCSTAISYVHVFIKI